MITVTKICFLIPQETVLWERERSPGIMSEDDLLWCFGGNVDFVDAESQQSRVAIDVPLLGFAGDLAMLAGQLRTDGNYEVPDRYGTYLLTFTVKGGDVVGSRSSMSGPVIVSASRSRWAISRRTMTPPSDDRRPASNVAVSSLPSTADRPGKIDVAFMAWAVAPVATRTICFGHLRSASGNGCAARQIYRLNLDPREHM
jgi:hypothetical protein